MAGATTQAAAQDAATLRPAAHPELGRRNIPEARLSERQATVAGGRQRQIRSVEKRADGRPQNLRLLQLAAWLNAGRRAPVQRRPSGSGMATSSPPIQLLLSERGQELAKRWEKRVLNTSTNRSSLVYALFKLNLLDLQRDETVDPADGERRLLQLLGDFPSRAPQLTEKAAKAHGLITDELERLTTPDLLVEQNLKRIQDAEPGPFNDTGRMLASIRSGGAFTAKKEASGDLTPELNQGGRDTLLENVNLFEQFTRAKHFQPAGQTFTLFRRIKSGQLRGLTEGSSINEIVPFSASWSKDMVLDWSPAEGLILELEVPVNYPAVFQARRPGADVPPEGAAELNAEQSEVTLLQSRLTLLEDPRREQRADGRDEWIARVRPEPLGSEPVRQQARALDRLPSEQRLLLAAQVRDEDPLELTEKQQKIAATLGAINGFPGLILAAETATDAQLKAIPPLLASVTKGLRTPAVAARFGTIAWVLTEIGRIGPGEAPLLASLLRKLSNPRFYVGADPATIAGLLGLLVPRIAKALTPG